MKKDITILFSHKSDHWSTPKWIYNEFMKQNYIDPCPLHSEVDNLNKIYTNQKIFVNPPYSEIDKWTEFVKNNQKENLIVLLIPARTDTKYFHELLKLKPKIIFIKGRLRFNETGTAPFPSILMMFCDNQLPTYTTLDPKSEPLFIRKII